MKSGFSMNLTLIQPEETSEFSILLPTGQERFTNTMELDGNLDIYSYSLIL